MSILIIGGDTLIYPSIDQLLSIVDSKYALVHIVAKRAKEMHETRHFQLKESAYRFKKFLGRSLEEVVSNLIIIK